MSKLLVLALCLLLLLAGFLMLVQRCGGRLCALINGFLLLITVSYLVFFLVSYFFTGNGIDNSVIFHLAYGLQGAGFREYSSLILTVTIGLIFLFVGAYVLGRWYSIRFGSRKTAKRGGVVAAYGLLVLGLLLSPTTTDLWRIAESSGDLLTPAKAPRVPFTEHYIRDEVRPTGERRRNLLFIYAESLERSYFDEKVFPGLIKELRRIESIGTSFTEIEQVPYVGWTIGGVVATQCGIPLVTPSHGNSMSGMVFFLPDAKCLGDYLYDAGYNVSVLLGSSKEFSGLNKFFASHGFTQIQGGPEDLIEQMDEPDYRTGWGLYDDSLFQFGEHALVELSARAEPFALFIATMDTHHPSGHPSASCNDIKYQNGKNPILNAVACSDRLISKFVDQVRASTYADDLVIVIASDHLAMRNTATSLLESTERRNLFLVVDPEKKGSKVEGRGSMIDVGSTLLPFLGFEGRIGLGRDLRREPSLFATHGDFSELLTSWKRDVMKLWNFPRIGLGDTLHVDVDKKAVRLQGRDFRYPLLITMDSKGDSTIRFNFDSSKSHKRLSNHLHELAKGTPFLWIDNCPPLAVDWPTPNGPHCLMYGTALNRMSPFAPLEQSISLLGAQLFYPQQEFIPRTQVQKEAHAIDRMRFIAHGGGMIDGRTYTNSLEALDHSYARGFRLFELDIIVTADGKYVAAHDWKDWKNKSGFDGELPPDHAAFMNHPILEKYTPLDMERINDWFTAHPDAVLVTDKINEPAEFARRFVDKKRLMMEIFSKAALIEALAVGIAAAMPSQNLITGSQGLSPTEMKAMGITSVAVSRRLIDRNLPLIGELGELGIKIYVFHVNFEEGKDERFVVCHDMNFIYGLYADSYDFSEPAVCN